MNLKDMLMTKKPWETEDGQQNDLISQIMRLYQGFGGSF